MTINPILGSNYRYDPGSGSFVHAKHQRIAEIIHDYNPDLELAWIPPAQRTVEDTKPFMVIHNQADGKRYPVFSLSEDELDERVLARLFFSDMRKHRPNDVMTAIEAAEAAEAIYRAKEHEDEMAEARDLAIHVLKSPLHKYKHGGKVFE